MKPQPRLTLSRCPADHCLLSESVAPAATVFRSLALLSYRGRTVQLDEDTRDEDFGTTSFARALRNSELAVDSTSNICIVERKDRRRRSRRAQKKKKKGSGAGPGSEVLLDVSRRGGG